MLDKLREKELFSRLLELNWDALPGAPATAVYTGVLHSTEEFPPLCGDSTEELKFREVSLIGGNTNFRPLGRGTEELMNPEDCRGFCGVEGGVLSSSKVTQLEWLVEHIVEDD